MVAITTLPPWPSMPQPVPADPPAPARTLSSANTSAVRRPIPCVAPVITAILALFPSPKAPPAHASTIRFGDA